MKTIWLLDVDGVINAGRAGWGGPPVSTYVRAHDGRDYRIRFEPEVIKAVRRLIAAGVVVTWCSTWCKSARTLESALGLPTMPVAFDDDCTGEDALWAKRDAALRAARAGRLVWTDDQIRDVDVFDLEVAAAANVIGSVAHEVTPRVPLIIAPQASRGLRRENIESIERYCMAQ